MNRQRDWKAVGMAIGVLVLVSSLQLYGQPAEAGAEAAAKEPTFVVFDAPGSTCELGFPFCTTPVAINTAKTVTGYYADTNGALHGFVRASDGTITAFDGPGAVCPSFFSTCTEPVGINPAGAITGEYCDAITCHGLLRTPDGTITPFDPPGSLSTFRGFVGSLSDFGFPAGGINPMGAITGTYFDANRVLHGFLRSPDGTFTAIDAPGAGAGGGSGTQAYSINPAGTITGPYFDANFVFHGFLRTRDGTFTTFDAPGAGTGPLEGTQPVSINPMGAITGPYIDASRASHGFLRARDGTFNTFDVPGATCGTFAVGINPAGVIVGFYGEAGVEGFCVQHGFVRASNGTFTTFDAPGAVVTIALAINPAGVTTGWWVSADGLAHGFLRIP